MDDRPDDPILDSRPAVRGPRTPLPEPAEGQAFGDYRLLEQVGAGGFSMVWRARHSGTGDVVALKLPRSAEFISHLQREALIAARFQDPQVVGVLGVRLDHDPPFLAMPFVEGRNLELPSEAPPPGGIVEAFRRFRKVVEVVARLHDAEIVHGDLKPGNLRFDPAGVCHVLDLGLARHQVEVRQHTTLRASVVSVTGEKIAGTLEFMAPEVLAGERPMKTADVYALGVILHALLCGHPPAFGVSPAELNPYLPPGATDFLRQMLEADPRRRVPSAGELLGPIDAFVRVEERCLRRRNGHARRLVLRQRMRTLGRGLKVLSWAALAAPAPLLYAIRFPSFEDFVDDSGPWVALGIVPAVVVGMTGMVLAMTTLNAWLLGIPEKTYKNRSGHPWWTFMMR